MSQLYLTACSDSAVVSIDVLVQKLERLCSLLNAILQSDRSRYLEARAWLLNSITNQSPPPHVCLACWQPLIAAAVSDRPNTRTTTAPLSSSSSLGQDNAGRERARDSGAARCASSLLRGGTSDGGGSEDDGGGAHPGLWEVVKQLLMLLSEVWPDRVAALLLERPHVFADFFTGPGASRRILLWFSHFSMEGLRAFRFGAHALAHYTLIHREEVWDLLRWEGKHPQAPVTVAAKPHYFCELAVVPSVTALATRYPAFWSSAQWRQAAGGGEFLQLDPGHWAQVLLSQLRGGGPDSAALSALLEDFLTSPPSPWPDLCKRLLHVLPDSHLLTLLHTLAANQPLTGPAPHQGGHQGGGNRTGAVAGEDHRTLASGGVGKEVQHRQVPAIQPRFARVCGVGGWQDLSDLALAGGVVWGNVGEAVLAHALAGARGPLQRLMVEGEEQGEVGGEVEALQEAAVELHGGTAGGGGGGGGAGPAEGCSPRDHTALLYGSRLELRSIGSGRHRLLLLAEMWSLREALRRGVRGRGREPRVAAHVGGSHDGVGEEAAAGEGKGGLLPLECVMEQVGGISFVRLQGDAEAGEGRHGGTGRGRRRENAAAAADRRSDDSAGGSVYGDYELLSSEVEGAAMGAGDSGGRRQRWRRRHDKSKSASKRRRRTSERCVSDEVDGGSRRRDRRRKRHRTRGRSRSNSSHSRSRSPGGGASPAPKDPTPLAHSDKTARQQPPHTIPRAARDWDEDRDMHDMAGYGGSGTDNRNYDTHPERSRSCEQPRRRRRRSRRDRSPSDSSDSSEGDGGRNRGAANLHEGARGVWRGREGVGAGMVWRVRLGGGVSKEGEGPGGQGVGEGEEGEVVGGVDDVADLLAAVACKHWVVPELGRRGSR